MLRRALLSIALSALACAPAAAASSVVNLAHPAPDGVITQLLAGVGATHVPSARPPTEQECLEAINDFWYHALWTAKKLRRGELLSAKGCCDGHLKELLLRMTAWHAGATRG